MTDSTTPDPTESLADPAALADDPDVDYAEMEDDSHFEMNRESAGIAAVAVTNDDGHLALAELENATIVPHSRVEPGDDFAAVAHAAADDLLGIDVTLDDLVRVRRNVSTTDDGETAVAHDVLYAASPAGDGTLPDADDVQSCQAEATGWFEEVPDDLPDGSMRADAELFLG